MIEKRQRTMYWASTKRRHYATLKQACKAEASAILTREWVDDGNDGLWLEHEEMAQRLNPLARDIEARYRAARPTTPGTGDSE